MKETITQARLREVLRYDGATGIFTWKVKTNRRTVIGARAGYIQKRGEARGRMQIRIDGKLYLAHRLAWLYTYGEFPPHTIDHKNTNPSDNRLDNLRAATQSQNNANTNPRGKSGRKGVHFESRTKKWVAQIKRKRIGRFESIDEAAAAYEQHARVRFGEFARTEKASIVDFTTLENAA